MLKIDGHNATDLDYVLTGKYPLYRSYSLTTWTAKTKNSQKAIKLVNFLQQQVERIHNTISYIPPSRLKSAGWKFQGDELIGQPATTNKSTK